MEKLKAVNTKQAESLQDKDGEVEELGSLAKKILSSNKFCFIGFYKRRGLSFDEMSVGGSEASPANQKADEPVASTSDKLPFERERRKPTRYCE
ncbi:unnamed protein product [Orchesella dallaii]|uniref:Uncharacterized protein n=1 Tax=Orchesella dallaii TaxID=48710 RepID=A0ABP1RMQ6_9HEXA